MNELHSCGYISIGCEPCTRPVLPNQHEREGRWWWEDSAAVSRPPLPADARPLLDRAAQSCWVTAGTLVAPGMQRAARLPPQRLPRSRANMLGRQHLRRGASMPWLPTFVVTLRCCLP